MSHRVTRSISTIVSNGYNQPNNKPQTNHPDQPEDSDPDKRYRFGVHIESNVPVVTYIRHPKNDLILPPRRAKAKRYTYTSLEQGHVRLLKRVPHPDPSLLIFEFVTAPVSHVEDQFSAISYCWGTLPKHKIITLKDGSYLPVTAKVEQILRHVISNKGNKTNHTLWLDAVCINQNDIEEKSLQIPIMAEIYGHAASVEIWLDSGKDSKASLRQFMERHSMNSKKAEFAAGMSREHNCWVLPPFSTPEIVELMWSPWFERSWVVQEFCYGKHHRFYFRDLEITSTFLNLVFEWGSDLAFGRVTEGDRCEIPLPPLIKNFANLMILRDGIHARKKMKEEVPDRLVPLEDILSRFYSLKASNPHDKIYAMLRLGTGSWPKRLKVDYTIPVAQLYLRIMIVMFKSGTDFCLLGFAGLTASRPLFRDQPDMPSWVPDFTTPPTHTVWACQYKRFNASGMPYKLGIKSPCFTNSKDTSLKTALGLRGICIDRIAGIIKGDSRHNIRHARTFIRSAIEKAKSLEPYLTGETAREVVRKTLVAGDENAIQEDPEGASFDRLCEIAQARDRKISLDDIWKSKGRYFQTMLLEGAGGSRGVIWTEKLGFMGLTSNDIRIGDEVWLIEGAKVPFILRESPEPKSKDGRAIGYELVCEAYIHGIMGGEMSELLRESTHILLF